MKFPQISDVNKTRLVTAVKVVGTIGLAVAGVDALAADATTNVTWTGGTAEVTQAAAEVKNMIQAGVGVVGIAFAWKVFRKA